MALAVVVLIIARAHGEQLNVRHYDSREGIPQIQVSAVAQDARGYLWVGTYGGLARYNGHVFRTYDTGDGLNSNYINVIGTDRDDRPWIGTARGVCRYVGNSFSCPEIPGFEGVMVNDLLNRDDRLWFAADEGLFRVADGVVERVDLPAADPGAVLSLAEDGDDRLWVGTSRGFFVRDADGFASVDVVDNRIHAMVAEHDRIWLGTGQGLSVFDIGQQKVSEVVLPGDSGIQINHLHLDPDGVLWVSSVAGLFRFENGRFFHYTTDEGLRNNLVFEVTTDREGMTWVATDQGLTKILPGPFAGYNADSGLLASFVRTINEGPNGRIWLGTRQGVQVVPYADGEWRFDRSEFIRTADGLPDNRVYSVVFPQPGRAYIATAEGVAHWDDDRGVIEVFTEADGLASNEIHALLIDREERLWIGSTRGVSVLENGRIRTARDGELAESFAIRIREDRAGRLWFATLRNGLLIREPDGEVMRFRADDGLTDEMLWDIAPSADGSMWVGSNGAGLFRVWPDGEIMRLDSADGLADNAVWQVLEDDEGSVWAYTNHGLSRLSEGEFTNYLERDGLLHLEGGATGAFQSSDGLLWFASADGLMHYRAEQEYVNTVPPPVVIERAVRGKDTIEPGVELPHRAGTIEFRFAGLSFQDEAAVRFRYRLVGANDQWSEPIESRSVTFGNLGPGDYVFEVRAFNPHGIGSTEPARFGFRVQRPFWLSGWFVVAVVMATVMATWMVIGWRLRRAEQMREQLQDTVRRRTAELRNLNRRLREASRTDQLTGLPNRRYLFDRIGKDVAQVHRAYYEKEKTTNRDLVFMMVDLDHFKQVNDDYGHDAGDRVLAQFSQVLAEQMRESDYTVRWGGEEFLIVACQAEAREARRLADRLIRDIRQRRFSIDDSGTRIDVNCSIGMACYPFDPHRPEVFDWEHTIQIADVAVYRAKSLGRDSWVELSPGPRGRIDRPTEFIDRLRNHFDDMIAGDEIRCTTSLESSDQG